MPLTKYYNYILRFFMKNGSGKQDAEDYTQEFLLHCWINRAKISHSVGTKFIEIAARRFYWSKVIRPNRQIKRKGILIPFDELRSACNDIIPVEQRILSQQLMSVVYGLKNLNLKRSILFLLENCRAYGALGDNAVRHKHVEGISKHEQMIRDNKQFLYRQVQHVFSA